MPLLITETGGADGGRSRLTSQARELIRRFHRVADGLHEQATARFSDVFRDGLA